ncbi:nicotinic acid mononucleotide adenyltransferase [Robertkochia marina]|uniref:Nicotinic acid mononucleotide adenyltransferase n=1 Tax=Robertkochia marina TaxID=1227945 RepID=A0A4S3M3V8_9FLAO|nr:nicotinic acid mononucleotide adenyltransferase [Robertkochia marina]THD69455.1 nicotinic acid mononucleotide adenyltransferase [Robertkochia marina]TRZ47653.1 nicotinic acid mononucleotide adenyltransferase [Robertkochia marina]
MRNIMLTFAMLFSMTLLAQEEIKPKYEIEGNMVKATYYHDNGKVAQTGYYLDGKLHGEWKAYNQEGKKIAMGTYNQGEKTGKWFFWSENTLHEANYEDSRLASVTKWNNSNSIVISN